jgi:hypothetical protein
MRTIRATRNNFLCSTRRGKLIAIVLCFCLTKGHRAISKLMIDLAELDGLAEEFGRLTAEQEFLRMDSVRVKDLGSALLKGYGSSAPEHLSEWQAAATVITDEGLHLVTTDTKSWWRRGTTTMLHLVAASSLSGGVHYTEAYRKGIDRESTEGVRYYPSGIIARQILPVAIHVTRGLSSDGHFDRVQFASTGNWWSDHEPLTLSSVESKLVDENGESDNCDDVSIKVVDETKPSAEHPVIHVRSPDTSHIIETVKYGEAIYEMMMFLKGKTTSVRPKSKGQKNVGARNWHDSLELTPDFIRSITSREPSELFNTRTGKLGAAAVEDILHCIEQLARLATLGVKTRDPKA